MEPDQVEAIGDAWLARTGSDSEALRTFLADAMPGADAWALRRAGALGGREPELLAVAGPHLYRITASDVDGHRAFGFERWPLCDISIAMVEWIAAGVRHRRWTLRMADAAFTVDTEQHPADGEPPAGEALMRLLLSRAG